MENIEFLYHMGLLKDLLKKKNNRIILFHTPYTITQQHIIDSVCRNSNQIIGQLERTNPTIKTAKELKRIISADKEPFVSPEELQYVILGRQKPQIIYSL
jgi:hypothetical protein